MRRPERYCPRCGTRSLIEKQEDGFLCINCGRVSPMNDWVLETYRRYGMGASLALWGITHRRLYKIPGVQQIRLKKILNQTPPDVMSIVLAEYGIKVTN